MTMRTRDRRALAFLGVSLILGLIYDLLPSSTAPAVVVPSADTAAFAEKRLAKLRDTAATVPAREEILGKVSAELSTREKQLIVADTAAQAQAQLIQIIRRVTSQEIPPIEIKSTELPGVRPFADAYGEADVTVQIDCGIDQLINLIAALAAQPEMVSTSDVRVTSNNAKDKTVAVRLTVAAIVPRKLVPEKLLPEKRKPGGTGL